MSVSKCFACGKPTSDTSLKICDQYLCASCEKELTKSQAGKVDYQYWIDSCRKFWEELEPKTGTGEN